MSKKERMIALLSAAATAENAEEDATVISDFQSLFEPAETREVMGGVFVNALGYDPITYYDRKDMSNIIASIASSVNERTAKYLRKHKDYILDRAAVILEKDRERNLCNAVVDSIKECGGDDLSDDSWAEIQDWVAEKFAEDTRPIPDFSDDDDEDDTSAIDASELDYDDDDENGIDVDDVDDDDHIDTSKLNFIDEDEDDELIDELMQGEGDDDNE